MWQGEALKQGVCHGRDCVLYIVGSAAKPHVAVLLA